MMRQPTERDAQILESLYELLARQLGGFRVIKSVFFFSQAFLLITLVWVHASFHREGTEPSNRYWWLLLAYAAAGFVSCVPSWRIGAKLKKTMLLINATAEGTLLQDEAEDRCVATTS